MGLDFSHGDAHWSYSGFNRARTRLAAVFGISLNEMFGFGGPKMWPDPNKMPIVHLLSHSDCDGDLSVKQCRAVAPALRKAVADWDEDDYDRQNFLALANAMDEAADADEPLEFQ